MSCTTCGSNAPCGCSNTNPTCSCDSAYNCNCGNIVSATPQPFYACAPACQESNTQKIVIQQFEASLKVANSWNVPGCGNSAVLTIPGLIAITIGSYLWNAAYGYFEVTAFDVSREEVTVVNHCTTGNAAAGTAVAACSEFLNTAPPADTQDSNAPCVAIDFTAPAVSACIDITLTSTNGISAGDVIQIGSGFYRVAAVKPNDIINICNDGEGITPGTSVIAKDSTGNYQYCITIISVSPCERPVVTEGGIVVCDVNGLTTVLQGPFPSDPGNRFLVVPALQNVASNPANVKADYEPIDAGKLRCTTLTQALNIISGTSNYTLNVFTSIGLGVGDIVFVETYPIGFVVTATSATSPGTLTVTTESVPGASVTLPANLGVCVITCCESLQRQIYLPVASSDYPGATLGTQTINSGATSFTSSAKTFATMINPGNLYGMMIIENISANLNLNVTMTGTDGLYLLVTVQRDINGAGYTTVAVKTLNYGVLDSTASTYNAREQILVLGVPVIVPPLGSAIISYKILISWLARGGASAALTSCTITGSLVGAY